MIIGGLELLEIDYLCETFELSRRTALRWLRTLHIAILKANNKAYFSAESLEITLRVIIESGQVFSMPGSTSKLSGREIVRGIVVMSSKMIKRVSNVLTQNTNDLNKRVEQWQKEKKQIQEAKRTLTALRKLVKESR